MKDFFKNPACPVGCEYCMVTRIDKRSSKWKEQQTYGINKTLLFINRLPGEILEYNKDFLKGEFLGFEGISDPFWNEYREDLFNFLQDSLKYKAKKVILVTKWKLNEDLVKRLSEYKNLVIASSITGLDKFNIERTTTKDRLKNIELLKKYNIPSIALIHPYIHGMSDLSFLKDLKNLGEKEVSVKGFRFNEKNMPIIARTLKEEKYFEDQENEILIGEDFIKNELEKNNLKNISFRKWSHRKNLKSAFNKISLEESKEIVEKLLSVAVVSSSESSLEEIKKVLIERRL